ncbi:MAG: GspH/FimT family pseudopilin [Steroidobacteraceae bacterium]|jgi:type IV fimbrial biogenesis protein FimT|nr:GspH/FimT family pseudopilin [Steroidobacteraceae bacterium]
MRGAKGLTLVEMLVVVAVLAAGATLVAPAFRDLLRDTRRAAALTALSHALQAARTTAASSGRSIRVCGTLDGRSCSGSTRWGPELLQRPAAGEAAALSRIVALPAGRGAPTVRANRAYIDFAPLAPSATTATITVCDDRGPPAARALIVSRTGRLRVSDRSASGEPLACPRESRP